MNIHASGVVAMLLAATASPALAQATPTFVVSDAMELAMMLQVIQQDAVVLLRPGAYGDVTLQNLRSGVNITIRSQNARSRATLGRVVVRNSARLRFDQVNFTLRRAPTEWDTVAGVLVRDSEMIHFTNCDFTGTRNGDANDDGMALRFMGGSNFVVLNSTFHETRLAIGASMVTHLVAASNTVTRTREGMNFSGARNILVDRNFFTDIKPNLAEADHSDAVQFFKGDATRHNADIAITNNVAILNGDRSQGYFIRNETGDPQFNTRNVTITNNLYQGPLRNAVYLRNVEGGLVSRNTVVSSRAFLHEPGIVARESVNVVIERSVAPFLLQYEAQARWTGNVQLWTAKTRVGVPTTEQFAGDVASDDPAIAAFAPRAGGAVATQNVGFRAVTGIGATLPVATANRTYATLQAQLRPSDGRGPIS